MKIGSKRWLVVVVVVLTLVVLGAWQAEGKDSFAQIQEQIFSNIQCLPFAYADFNADKRIDIYCVADAGRRVEIWTAQEREPLFNLNQSFNLKGNQTIVNLVPADFNGDSVIDLLVTYEVGSAYQMSLFLGDKPTKTTNSIIPSQEIIIDMTILGQPFVADFDGDGKVGVLVQTAANRTYLNFNDNGNLLPLQYQVGSPRQLLNGYASAITDVNNDYKPDLVLTSKDTTTKSAMFEVWETVSDHTGLFSLSDEYSVPDTSFIYGQSIFADFDSDGSFEHLLPACKDVKCKNSTIFIYKDSRWNELPIDFGHYTFVPPSEADDTWGNAGIVIKAGDYDLNGYLDLLAVLKFNNDSAAGANKNSNHNIETYAILLSNIPSGNSTVSPTFTRTFKIESHIITLFGHNNVVQASFFDLNDDGFLDILIAVREDANDHSATYRVLALTNELYDDVYFLKVMVIPGRCDTTGRDVCPFQNLPYGIGYPGALIKIETTSVEYQKVQFYSSQLSQTSYMSLQLPYVIIGLGSTPNFIEHLTVGILSYSVSNRRLESANKEWTQIIPNSQLVINPNPRTVPYYWKMQLFITPSKNILMTFISLGSTMIWLVVIIGILQYREKKMDEKERKLESQRFHFDGL